MPNACLSIRHVIFSIGLELTSAIVPKDLIVTITCICTFPSDVSSLLRCPSFSEPPARADLLPRAGNQNAKSGTVPASSTCQGTCG